MSLVGLLLLGIALQLLLQFPKLVVRVESRQVASVVKVHFLNSLETLRIRGARRWCHALEEMLLEKCLICSYQLMLGSLVFGMCL